MRRKCIDGAMIALRRRDVEVSKPTTTPSASPMVTPTKTRSSDAADACPTASTAPQ